MQPAGGPGYNRGVMMRRAVWVLAVSVCAGAARAQERPPALQGPWTYQVEGALVGAPIAGRITLDRVGADGVSLEARLSATGGGKLPASFSGRGQAQTLGWRFPLSAGMAARLSGPPSARHADAVLVRRLPGDAVRGWVILGGRVRGTFTGQRVADPSRPCRPTRDAWWARHAVATWEVGRALWDFYRPGSERLEALRGDVTPAQTAALRAALAGPGPFSPEQVYAAARARTGDAAAALQLSFALTLDHPELPYAPLPGIPAEAPREDKYKHFFASAIMARRGNARGSFTVGWLKEVMDELTGSGYDDLDLMADALGAEFGQSLQCECAGPIPTGR